MTADLFGVEPSEHEGDRDCWTTPDRIYLPLHEEFGFGWDLAASEENTKCPRFFTIDDDALSRDWTEIALPMWLNCPFSKLPEFVEKASASSAAMVTDIRSRAGSPIVMLMPSNRNDQDWFHDYVIGVAAEVRMIRGRVAYNPPPGVKATSPSFGSQVVIFDPARFGECKLGSIGGE